MGTRCIRLARGLYSQYAREGASFIPKHKKLLNAASLMRVEAAANIAGISLTNKAFWEEALGSFAAEIGGFARLI